MSDNSTRSLLHTYLDHRLSLRYLPLITKEGPAFGGRPIARRGLIFGAITTSVVTRDHNLSRWGLRLRIPASKQTRGKSQDSLVRR